MQVLPHFHKFMYGNKTVQQETLPSSQVMRVEL